jgi:guanosine-3',5'-bis(diphosphate) 3'-pyrophosphohydrolase
LRKLKTAGIPNNNPNYINEIASHFKYSSPNDLYYAVAVGSFDLKYLKEFTIKGDKLIHKDKLEQKDNTTKSIHPNPTLDSKLTKEDLIIFGESSDKILYDLAQCCQPIPGDDVFGFVTTGKGMIIHRISCPNAAHLFANYAHRVVKTKWAKNKEISFLTGVKLTGLDDVGIIQGITNIITGDMKLNMRSISIDSTDGIFEGTIMVFVHDKEEFDFLCEKLSNIRGINKVERIDSDNNFQQIL